MSMVDVAHAATARVPAARDRLLPDDRRRTTTTLIGNLRVAARGRWAAGRTNGAKSAQCRARASISFAVGSTKTTHPAMTLPLDPSPSGAPGAPCGRP